MSQSYESPKNCKKTNPIEYDYYQNVKERHYLGKYKPNKDSIGYKNSKNILEIETFQLYDNKNNNNSNISNGNNNISNFNGYNRDNNKITLAIKSTII